MSDVVDPTAVPSGESGAANHLEHQPGDADLPDGPETPDKIERALRSIIEWLVVIVGALAVALLLRSYVFQVYQIPSSSMAPTLRDGDRILVNKLDDNPDRGELIVFARPENFVADAKTEDLVKRVIGLPGESVSIEENRVFIDGELLEEAYLGDGVATTGNAWHELCDNGTVDNAACIVPDGWYFVMGDNRSASADGRVFGPIDGSLIEGRAVLRIYPLGEFGGL